MWVVPPDTQVPRTALPTHGRKGDLSSWSCEATCSRSYVAPPLLCLHLDERDVARGHSSANSLGRGLEADLLHPLVLRSIVQPLAVGLSGSSSTKPIVRLTRTTEIVLLSWIIEATRGTVQLKMNV